MSALVKRHGSKRLPKLSLLGFGFVGPVPRALRATTTEEVYENVIDLVEKAMLGHLARSANLVTAPPRQAHSWRSLSENKLERDRLLTDISRRLGVEDEPDLATITNVAAEGTDMAACFPVSQEELRDAVGPIWNSRMTELFLIPDPS